MHATITDRIITIIDGNFDTGDSVVAADTDLDSLGFDSLVLVEMALIISREFGATITDEELARCVTVDDVAQITEEKIGMNGAARQFR